MNATIYGRGQMVIPAKARKAAGIQKGDVFSVQAEGQGKLVLVRMEVPSPPTCRLVYKKGRPPVIVGGPKITTAMVKEALADFP
jgi:AbrB family looped-hinge helix DNA binding protein